MRAVLLLIALLGLPSLAQAQLWSDILHPSRATQWQLYSGITGGVPTDRVICGAPLANTSTHTQINNAISGCAAPGKVVLGVGTFNLTGGITFGAKNNITLEGMGASLTKLVFTGSPNACTGSVSGLAGGPICIQGTSGVWAGFDGDSGSITSRNWTSSYAQGTTVLPLSSVTGLVVGMIGVLDQCDETTDDGGITNSASAVTPKIFMNEDQTRGRKYPGVCPLTGSTGLQPRSLNEFKKVTAIDTINSTITVTPPVMMPTWRSSQSPQFWHIGTSNNTWIQGSGIRNFSVDARGTSFHVGVISVVNAFNVFVDGVRCIGFYRGCISVRQVGNLTIQHSYIVKANSFGATRYGIDILSASNLLIVNNLCQYMVACHMGPSAGSVVAYNYGINFQQNAGDLAAQRGIFATHDAGGGLVLYEGNQLNGLIADFPHGQSPLIGMFRNHFRGLDERTASCCNQYRAPIVLQSFARGWWASGNVLGLNSFHTTYESNCGAGGSCTDDNAIYSLGDDRGGSTPIDPLVSSTLLRWCNFDVATDSTRCLASEIPTAGILRLPGNPVPSTTVLPSSFFLTGRPGWFDTPWGNVPFPPIGPEVTGGNHPDAGIGGRSYKIPARLCYENATVDPAYSGQTVNDRGILLFDAATCYPNMGGSDTTPPAAPTNLRFAQVQRWMRAFMQRVAYPMRHSPIMTETY